MSYCINPQCSQPQNSRQPLFCQACGSDLLLQGRYRVIRQLAGNIYEVDDSGTKKILKVLFNNHPQAIGLFQQEAEVLKRLNHPGVPKVKSDGYFTYTHRDSQQPLHCLVMEKIEGVNLEEYLTQRNHRPIGERTAVHWLKQLTEILHALHQQQYFHSDIKPPNIILRPGGQLVLINFGTAPEVTQAFIQKVPGQKVTGIISPGYTPSEQINAKAVPQSDFFALGRTFVYLLTGKSPENLPNQPRTGELIWRTDAMGISQKLLDFIDDLMAPCPENRPSDTQEILQKLSELETSLTSLSKNQRSGNLGPNYTDIGRRAIAQIIDISILTIATSSLSAIILSLALPSYPNILLTASVVTLYRTVCGTLFTLFLIFSLCIVHTKTDENTAILIVAVLGMIVHWLYFTLFEISKQQATPGKMVLKIIVTDENQNRLTFGKANKRYWSKTLSGLFLIGFTMTDFTEENQALHDRITNTTVLNKT